MQNLQVVSDCDKFFALHSIRQPFIVADVPEKVLHILCKSIVVVVIAVMHYKFFSSGKPAFQILFLMLRKFVMHLYEKYDAFAVHTSRWLSILRKNRAAHTTP